MDFSKLKDYLISKMRMSHIYQPVMIKELLTSPKPISTNQIARKFLEYDVSQIEYYERIVKNMPGRVLTRHGVVQKEGNSYYLDLGQDYLSDGQRDELIKLCEDKIDEYIQRRGDKIWQHRKLSERAIPGSIRYEVLKRAGFKCQSCGMSADIRALEGDHIIPRNLGGPNDIDNYQALCYKCNANKRDTDSTDFREWKNQYAIRASDCLFCNPDRSRVLADEGLSYVMRDKYPVSEGHILIIPKRHVPSFFDLFTSEIGSCFRLVDEFRRRIETEDSSVKGFNVGVNVSSTAGQTIRHCHLHLIPRRLGDVENPRGGIRNIVRGKGDYGR